MNIAFVGIGNVGSALAGKLLSLGHTVTIAARDQNSASVKKALNKYPNLKVARPKEAANEAEIIFLATPFSANETALQELGDISGKILVDCTNPVSPNLTHGLNNSQSGGEFVQNLIPDTKVVKAFTIYGFENFENNIYPGYGQLKPAMLIAGNDPDAKQVIADLCQTMGWEPVDTGNISTSLHLEHLTLLWIKMARVQGLGTNFVWAKLQR